MKMFQLPVKFKYVEGGYFIEADKDDCHYGQYYSKNPDDTRYAKDLDDAIGRFRSYYNIH